MRNYFTQFNHIISFQNVAPYLYRYEDTRFIDDFFSNGNIFLSSFMNYRMYKDNELGDKSEGHALAVLKGDNNKNIGTYSMVGQKVYCFCTSTILDDKLKNAFNRNDVFKIIDPINFILEINRSLARVHQVLFGNCIYIDKRILTKRVPKVDIDDFKDDKDPEKISLDKLLSASQFDNGPDQFFLKKIVHQHQSEYRIIWLTDRNIEEGIIVNCIEATKYCERI